MSAMASAPRPVAAWGLVALSLAAALALAFGLGGPAAFGRLALSLGLETTAVRLLEDPGWHGVALYRQGRFAEAAEAFRVAGPRASFNRGNALARAGRYREAVAAYDAVLFRDPGDAAARANRALVAPLVEPVVGERRQGRGIAATAPPEDSAAGPKDEGPITHEQVVAQMRKLFKSKALSGSAVRASRQWLATLPDQPWRYLRLRLAAERERRQSLGLAVPGGGDPW